MKEKEKPKPTGKKYGVRGVRVGRKQIGRQQSSTCSPVSQSAKEVGDGGVQCNGNLLLQDKACGTEVGPTACQVHCEF